MQLVFPVIIKRVQNVSLSGKFPCDLQMVLLIWTEGVVDVSLQVDGEVRDPEQRPGDMDEPLDELLSALQRRDVRLHVERTSFTNKNTPASLHIHRRKLPTIN